MDNIVYEIIKNTSGGERGTIYLKSLLFGK